jgi:hypothetical protein
MSNLLRREQSGAQRSEHGEHPPFEADAAI